MFCNKYKKEIAILDNRIILLETHISVLESRLKPKKKKPRLTNKKGYKIVSPDESLGMFEMYNQGSTLLDIARAYDRSSSCVHNHIVKHLEE